ncbi:LRR domain containing protein [Parasponia andersonii]|uniref:LRR domain containing protein n=1 Tax=Parasponia andersonii TaxID=3476 RepID=A0A2P5DSM0_PARAD|nr:LRR domain containing protein [Parasponia andersonii]
MAERYMDDLVRRSLLQVFEDHSQGSPKALRMHDLLRHLVVRISQEKKFCAVYNGGKAWEERRLYQSLIQRNYEEEDQTRKAIEKLKKQIELLSLVTFNENEVLRIDNGNFGVSSPLSNPLNLLTTLALGGKLERLPCWFDRSDRYLKNFKALHLHWSSLTDEDFLSRIGKLANLVELVLRNAYEGYKLLFLEGFEKLRCLSLFYFPELNEIVIEKGVMPALGYFHIFHCEELKRPPSGVEHLHCLRELHLAWVSNELIERVCEGGSDRSMVKHIRHIWHQGTFPEYLS